MAVSHQPKDMVKSCTIQGSSDLTNNVCDKFLNNETWNVFTPSKGVCYMINFSPNTSNALTFDEANSEKSLLLNIDIEGKCLEAKKTLALQIVGPLMS